jgi:type I restriction enzyme R subunit
LSLRSGLQTLPHLKTDGLRACQITAITNLETSLQRGKPRALAQMATGSGKTFTAITEDLDNLPEPDVLMSEIMENLEAAMEQFAAASRA